MGLYWLYFQGHHHFPYEYLKISEQPPRPRAMVVKDRVEGAEYSSANHDVTREFTTTSYNIDVSISRKQPQEGNHIYIYTLHIHLSGASFCFLLVKKFVNLNDERNIKSDTITLLWQKICDPPLLIVHLPTQKFAQIRGKCLQEDVQEEGLLEAKLGDKVTVLEEHQGEDKAQLMLRISKVVGWKLGMLSA